MSEPEQSWQKLVDAARKAPPPPEAAQPASPGFSNRVVAMRDSIAAFVRTMAWQRWSVLVAVICGLIFLAVLAVTRCSGSPRPLIDPPSQPLLHPPAQPNP